MAIQLYDRIGQGYAGRRRPDPRIATQIHRALGNAATVLNVGAGSGSYEPAGRPVVAIEPSVAMIRQRSVGSAPVVRAVAEALPFRTGSFDAALAVLTLHHWQDWRRGVAEMLRIAPHVVILTWDPDGPPFWLMEEYFPELLPPDRARMPAVDQLAHALGGAQVNVVPIPADCTDGFLGAYWRRPHAYLDAGVRGAISVLADLAPTDPRLLNLEEDLKNGAWQRRHGHLSSVRELDLGYRLVIAGNRGMPSA